ncbi:hypothetical protein EDD22DRAFT_986259 [Suillus occidentalis]|nr:hypothetical protein EDD22DRAFT_986259 [Suillus occidentalis]
MYLLKQVFKKKNPAYSFDPLGWSLIGNVLDMPHIRPWLTFMEQGKKYSDNSHIEVLGQHNMVLNSLETAMDMLDNKSTIYSDCSILPVAYWLSKHYDSPPLCTAGAVILCISHGYEVKENDNPFIELADHVLYQWPCATALGAFMADVIPFLVKIPKWFPGAGFKHLACKWHNTLEELVSAPYNFILNQMSFTLNLLGGGTLLTDEEDDVKWSAATLYGGASKTITKVELQEQMEMNKKLMQCLNEM